MKKTGYKRCLLLLSLLIGTTGIWAEEMLPPKLQKLTDEAYH